MWNLVRCYLSGRHDYGVGCEPGSIFLRCVHCGHRSSGWAVDAKPMNAAAFRAPAAPRPIPVSAPTPVPVPRPIAIATALSRPVLAVVPAAAAGARVIPFQRSAAR